MKIDKLFKRTFKIILLALLAIMAFNFIACDQSGDNINNVDKIEIISLPSITEYETGSAFNVEGGKIKVIYADESEKELSFSDEGVFITGANTAAAGEKTVSVVYYGRVATFKIKVASSEDEPSVVGIAMNTMPAKTVYKVGEMFRSNRGSILVTFSDAATKILYLSAEDITLSSVDTSSVGEKTVNVTYGGQSTSFAVTVSSDGGTVEKQVRQIRVTTLPDITEYFVNDTFNPAGAIVTVTYFDSTEEALDILSEGITVSQPNMGASGQKNVTVTYEGNSTTFSIRVVVVGAIVTFDHNYTGGPADTVRVAQNRAVSEPEAPVRSGFTFYKWYLDKACTLEYVFSNDKILTSNLTLYAQWKEDGAAYYDVVYDLNYYGVNHQEYPQIVKSGEKARAITGFTPKRAEHSFEGWFTDAAGLAAFNSDNNISSNLTIYAKWLKTKTGSSEYIFEAENTDLTGKSGPGASGDATGTGMIVDDEGTNFVASNGAFISFLYKDGLTLDFHIAANESDNNATIKVRIAAELNNINLTSATWQVIVNGTSQHYPNISVVNGAAFADSIVISGVSLSAGHNYIALKTNNSVNPVGSGTYSGTAPIVDCVKITTTAVLIWDGKYNLPMNI